MNTHAHTHIHSFTTHTCAAPSKDILGPDPDAEIAQPFKRSPNEYDSATLWNSSCLSFCTKTERERGRVCYRNTRATAHEKVDNVRECADTTRKNAHLASLASLML